MKRAAAGSKRAAERSGKPGRQTPKIKVTRNSPRPEIKASRGPGGPARRRKVAQPQRTRQSAEIDRRVAETRRQSLSSLGGQMPPARAVSGGSGGAAAAARVLEEVVRPVGAVTRPVLRAVSGGLEAIPGAAGRATPVARSRLLILIVGLLAAGLIYINVGRLEYGDGYAKYAERSLELQRENTVLRSRIANLGAAQRIKLYAERQGMVMPAPEQFEYLRHRRNDAERAARGYSAPLTSAVPNPPGASAQTGAATGPSAATGAGL